jgi:peptide/nickel transport system substrate-binding protein
MLSGDAASPPAVILKKYLARDRDQFQGAPQGGDRYISLNSRIRPFNNVNVRRAVAAVINRYALRQARGGGVVGTLATHFVPPGMPGFNQAGASQPLFDFYKNPLGNLGLARQYMRKAGYPSGRYTGKPVLAVGDSKLPGAHTADQVKHMLRKIGIRLRLIKVPHAIMYSKYCQVPKARVAVCPNLAWSRDFYDPQSMLDPLFNGRNIVPSGNVNTTLLDDKRINARLDSAASITDPAARAQIYGQLDRTLTGRAYYIAYMWTTQVVYASKNVNGVTNAFSGNTWDLTFSSLK